MSAQLKRSVEAQNISEKVVENMKEDVQATIKELENVKIQLKNEQELHSIEISRPIYVEKQTQTMFEEIVISFDPESNLVGNQSQHLVQERVKENEKTTSLPKAQLESLELKEAADIDIFQENHKEKEIGNEAPTSKGIQNC